MLFSGINTRTLTKKIRSQGTMLCKLRVGTPHHTSDVYEDPNLLHLVDRVSTKVRRKKLVVLVKVA